MRRPRPVHELFSLLDEMTASPIMPMNPAYTVDRITVARLCVESLRAGTGLRYEWLVMATICNVFEVMLKEGFVQDPDGLLEECQRILMGTNMRWITAGDGALQVDETGYFHLNSLVTDFEECLTDAPARLMVRSIRLADAWQREHSVQQPANFLAKTL